MNKIIEINRNLLVCLKHLTKYPNMCVDGDNIDTTIFEAIKKHTHCKELKEESYKELKPTIIFNDISGDIHSKTQFEKPAIVRQPNGKQQYPDILLLYNFRGMSFEIKSSKDKDVILWNSGFPRDNGIYIFNGTSAFIDEDDRHTTFFVGRDLITKPERDILIEGRDRNKRIIDEIINPYLKWMGSDWNYYARPMFNNLKGILNSPLRDQREQNVFECIKNFNWI